MAYALAQAYITTCHTVLIHTSVAKLSQDAQNDIQ